MMNWIDGANYKVEEYFRDKYSHDLSYDMY